MWGVRSARTAAITAAATLFFAASVLPLALMLGSALAGRVESDSPFAALLLDSRQRMLLYNTTLLGLSTAALATLIGVPLGVALGRMDLPWKRTLRVLLAAPLLLPPYIVALAWVSLGGS